jgi:hypothetical protein
VLASTIDQILQRADRRVSGRRERDHGHGVGRKTVVVNAGGQLRTAPAGTASTTIGAARTGNAAGLWQDDRVENAVVRFRRASEANDIDGMIETLTPDVELVSPISGRMVFRGPDDLRVLLTAVYGSITGLRWRSEFGDGDARVVIGDGKVGRLRLGDAMVLELADDGRIRRIGPHLRPWLALTALAIKLGPKLGRHPGVVLRALRRA